VRGGLGQASLISVVLLVGVSLVVGLSIVALFTNQVAVISSQEDISDVVAGAAASEFVTLVYHHYNLANPNDPSAGYNHTFMFEMVLLSYGVRKYFLVVPLITLGSPSNIYIERNPTLQLWSCVNFSYMGLANSAGYVPIALSPQKVSGDDVLLTINGLDFKSIGISEVPMYWVPVLNTTPYPSTYITIKFTAPPGWENYDFTLYTFVQVGTKFYLVEKIPVPLGGGA